MTHTPPTTGTTLPGSAATPVTEPKRTVRYPIERYNRITTLRFSVEDQQLIAELLDERIARTGRNHSLSSMVRDLIRTEHRKRC